MSWSRRLSRLETQAAGLPRGVDIGTLAMTEAMERADIADMDLLYEGIQRVGMEGVIEVEVLHPLLEKEEAGALERLVELADEVLEEWGVE